MLPIGLFVSDVDRTLLTRDYVLPDRVAAALARLKSAGVPVVLASARSPAGLRPYAERIGCLDLAICFNGGWIGSLRDDRALASTPISRDEALQAMAAAEGLGVTALWYGPQGIATVGGSPLAEREAGVTGEPLARVDRIADLPGAPGKIMCVREGESGGGFEELGRMLGDRFAVAASHPRLLEIGPSGVSKRAAIAEVAARLGVEQARTAAAGDAENDIGMLRWAGLRVTVGNAIPQIRLMADFVGPSCDEGGLAEAIDWLRGDRRA